MDKYNFEREIEKEIINFAEKSEQKEFILVQQASNNFQTRFKNKALGNVFDFFFSIKGKCCILECKATEKNFLIRENFSKNQLEMFKNELFLNLHCIFLVIKFVNSKKYYLIDLKKHNLFNEKGVFKTIYEEEVKKYEIKISDLINYLIVYTTQHSLVRN